MTTRVLPDAVRSIAVVAGCLAGASLVAAPQTPRSIERTVYFTATDAHGAYVDDLTSADLVVREAGRERQVLRVAPLQARLKVALAIDEALSPLDEVRRAAATFVDRLQGVADVALYLVAGTATKIVDFSADTRVIRQALSAIPNRPQGGGNLVESMYRIAADTRALEGRRVIVILTPEIPQRSGMTANGVLDQLRDFNAVLHAATLIGPAGTIAPATPEMAHLEALDEVERDRLLNDGPKQSGGLRLSLLRLESFPAALDRIRSELVHQCEASYAFPAGVKSDGRLSLTSRRKGVTIRGSRQMPKI